MAVTTIAGTAAMAVATTRSHDTRSMRPPMRDLVMSRLRASAMVLGAKP